MAQEAVTAVGRRPRALKWVFFAGFALLLAEMIGTIRSFRLWNSILPGTKRSIMEEGIRRRGTSVDQTGFDSRNGGTILFRDDRFLTDLEVEVLVGADLRVAMIRRELYVLGLRANRTQDPE
jgi:hypothetical protein